MRTPLTLLRRVSPRLRLLFAGGALLAAGLIGFSFFELRESRADLLQSVRLEAETLIDAINRGSESAIISAGELEDALQERLRAAALLIGHLEEHRPTRPQLLRTLAAEQSLGFIAIVGPNDRVLAASLEHAEGLLLRAELSDALRGSMDSSFGAWLPGTFAPFEGCGPSYLLAVPRRDAMGVVLVGVDAAELLAFRRKIGVGKLVRDIGRNPDIAFVALQDEDGIVAASAGLASLGAIEEDSFLARAFHSNEAHTRVNDSSETPFLEVARSLRLADGSHVLTRIGLRLDNVRRIQRRGLERLALLTAALFAGGIVLLLLVATRERFSALRRRHAIVQSTTDLVLENMADAVIAVDSNGVIAVFNSASERMFAIPALDAIGKRCRDLCPDDPFRLLHTIATGTPVLFEEREHRAAGRTLSIALSTSLLRGEDGSVELAIALVRDVTDEKRFRARLEQHERLTAMGALASGIAHEIRNPLNAIHMIVQRFRKEFVPREDADEYRRLADTMRSEVLRVNAIITQFLEFARPPKPDLRAADLAEVLRRGAAVIASEAAAAGVAVVLDLPASAPCALDEQRLLQALLNVFQNAVQAMPGGGTLSVTLHRRDDFWQCVVGDTGIGIAPEALAKIFNLYYTTKSGGSGIGLSIVHQIVSEHGGDIAVQSAPGSGSTFVISLPAL